MPTPCLIASLGAWKLTCAPLTKICPASGRYNPARMLISVLLPAPFSPSKACTSPHRAEKSTPWFATTPGKALSIPTIEKARSAVTRRESYRARTSSGLGRALRARPRGARSAPPNPYLLNCDLTLRNIADDIAKSPVHLVGLRIGVVFGLAWLGRRALVEIAERLACGRFH